ncbi:ribosome recycling factor family protein [Vibrio sp. HN007]|uniref:ribosome recycling factor family protein n=1 Tax=Vibrio iocasae TaxID=3098914 RepID=UPI0035D4A991
MPDTVITIALPSLIHRIGGDEAKKARSIATRFGCKLSRVRRSRNWQITGLATHQNEFYQHLLKSELENPAFLIKKMQEGLMHHQDKLEPKEAKIKRLLLENPTITLSELMQLTDCTLGEARKVRFECELL